MLALYVEGSGILSCNIRVNVLSTYLFDSCVCNKTKIEAIFLIAEQCNSVKTKSNTLQLSTTATTTQITIALHYNSGAS